MAEDCYDYETPKRIADDLKAIDKALTEALGRLVPLRLEHREGQDIIKKPYNHPVAMALDHGRVSSALLAHGAAALPLPDNPCYPTAVIQAIRELRDVARHAEQMGRPSPGNASRRDKHSARKSDLAKNLVFQYRATFGHMPPMSKTGRVVELLRRMFETAGIESGDHAENLRGAIERDQARGWLPSASKAAKAKRVK